ncbi:MULTISPECIES: serine hydrolase domain-containing protein [unclassified Streptomyces]|uniref:serine hydrolase domain-containing protein n=1 Tax=unclassified Streptomyces TaxID=2593676 RepID=UPI000DC77B00|nr:MULTISPECIES: serine hydrolase domain-containing protein [unclassified Streptomyces]AWZ04367.1 peptidase [Streptomyces sp. ICC4]AWZ14272.1 peptidase [Streptomyces sp. ICC1]
MNATTRTLLAAALVLGVAAGPAVAHAAPAPASASASAPVSASPSALFSTPPDAAALERAIAGLGADHKYATAASVRVSGPSGSWRGSSGVSDVRTGAAAIADGRFRAGSVTKTFTAAVVLQLAAERRVDLDRPVQEYLPGTFPENFEPISVRQLLNYTSGIRAADGPGDSFSAQWEHRFDVTDPHAQIANALAKGPESAPGAFQHYQNINYTLLGVLIEKVTGSTYEKAVEKRILKPLGLRQTSLPGRTQTRIPGRHNLGYQAVPLPGGGSELRDVSVWNVSDRWAAGDLISSTADLERFTRALFAGRIVPRPQLEEMFTVPEGALEFGSATTPASRTAGMQRLVLPDGTVVYGKTGARPGYSTGIGGAGDGSRIVVFTVNSKDAKSEDPSPVTGAIVAASMAR